MSQTETQKAWERFQVDAKDLASELRRHYDAAGDDEKSAELNRSLEQLRQAADTVFRSLETATQDPAVRTRTKSAARSFGTALTETFRELGVELDRALRKPAAKA